MSLVLTDDTNYKNIANAIRAKTGTEQTYMPEQMSAAIESIPGTEMEDALVERTASLIYENDRVTTVGEYGLAGNYFTKILLPNVISVSTQAMYRSYKCIYFGLQSLENLGPNGIQTSQSVEVIALPSIKTIQQASLSYCSKLSHVIIGKDGDTGVCELTNSNAFLATPIASGTGYIYVPDDLVEQYKVATNWSVYADQIKGLSEIPEEVQQWINEQEEQYGTN